MNENAKKIERFVLGWESGDMDLDFLDSVLSDRVKSVMESPHGITG